VRPPRRWRFSAFDPLSFVAFSNYPDDLPARKWLKRIPLFAGRLGESIKDHLDKFLQVMWEFNVEHEYVLDKFYVLCLAGMFCVYFVRPIFSVSWRSSMFCI